jgi:alpha-mannosidase
MKKTLLAALISLAFSLTAMAQGTDYFAKGVIHIIPSSHQDIAWMDSPENCKIQRDTMMIAPAIKLMQKNPAYKFSVEQVLNLEEYLDLHPDQKPLLEKLTREGKFEWGGTYIQPYENMYSGEALIRQTYFGRKYLHEIFPGCDTRIYWNPDVPSRSIQMPQILKKSGINYMSVSRMSEGFYDWTSPDGTGILTYSPGHYTNMINLLFKPGMKGLRDINEVYGLLKVKFAELAKYYKARGIPPHICFILSTDAILPVDMNDFIAEWNSKISRKYRMPVMQYSTIESFMDEVAKGKLKIEPMVGERPNVWFYKTGPSHHQTLQAGRDAWRTLTEAEEFSSFGAILSKTVNSADAGLLHAAWKEAIYPDHGWGGQRGAITDSTFFAKFLYADKTARQVRDRSFTALNTKIGFQDKGYPVVVYNTLSWNRTDVVKASFNAMGRSYVFDKTSLNFKLVDQQGNEVPMQATSIPDKNAEPSERYNFTFVAKDVPAMGYKTYYLVMKDAKEIDNTIAKGYTETPYYMLVLGKGGISSLIDKELNKELLNTGKFQGAELFTMRSEGLGAGEFTEIQQPDMQGFAKLSEMGSGWSCIESGKVRSVWETSSVFSHCTARLRVILYKEIKRIDVETDLLGWDGTIWREFRLAFPLNLKNGKVVYEGTMAAVEVGKDEPKGAAGYSYPGVDYSQPYVQVRPREIQNWFAGYDSTGTVMITSGVMGFDWVDPTTDPVKYPVLQPVLLASRRSCHWLGNWFLDPGDHHFEFSITSNKGDWRNSYHAATSAAQPMLAVCGVSVKKGEGMPESQGFVSLNKNNVIVSTLKKADDTNDYVIRLYEMEGRDTEVTVTFPFKIGKAWVTDMIEEGAKEIPVVNNSLVLKIGHNAIETFRVSPEHNSH